MLPQPIESIPRYFCLWAKSEKSQDPDTHPLIYHLLDVGECTLALWKVALSAQTKQTFAHALDLDPDLAGRQLAFWAALHDLGKAAPGFQRKYPPSVPKLEKEGFVFPREVSPNPAPHGILSAWALKELLPQETGLSRPDAVKIAVALGGHHGAWPTNDRFSPASLKSSDKGDANWQEARRELLQAMQEVYRPPATVKLPAAQEELNAFLTLFSGLVSVADWIGSMSENFPFTGEYLPPQAYARRAAGQARAALEKLGWLGWGADGSLLTFAAMFPDIGAPNGIQQSTFEAALELALPALVILEAPTGIGKTEAALFLADTWLQSQKGSGLYVAMPTQATSNQMFARVVDFLKSRYPAKSINAHLVHGSALLEEREAPQISGIAQDDAAQEGGVKAETWFLPRKRTLLAPFGVGTVDQALLSVLQTRHFFVRMFGLGQKVVVFDEVHAYDTYMSTLFERLLRWLHSIGTSVILLSATLPQQTRQAFVQAWLGAGEEPLPVAAYPRVTVASAAKVAVRPLPPPPSRTLRLAWAQPSPGQSSEEWIAETLAERLEGGGCAAVICNRVRRAQDVYAVLREKGVVADENLILFHARFPFEWRKRIEDEVLSRFSKGGKRPKRAIVVATQVIEQSLDLDFDAMLTDLAPVDLLLQRAGRLHRHAMNDEKRPEALKNPCLTVISPPVRDGLPDFGLDAHIYDEATLLRTWLLLHDREQLALPEDTSGLIEAVYGGEMESGAFSPAFAQALHAAEEKARQELAKEVYEAKKRLIAGPEDEELLSDRNEGLEEDDARVNEALRALTRLAEPGITLICLHETAQGVALEPDGYGAPIDVRQRPNLKGVKELLRRAVSVQRRDVVDFFVKHVKTSAAWRESAAVRYAYPVVFDHNGEAHLDGAGFTLRLTRELGLEVLKEAK